MEKKWKAVITARVPFWSVNFREIWEYRDLCLSFVKRNFVTKYKQTVLGPLYIILAPLLTSGIFTIVFGEMIGFSTNEIPNILFFMSGNILWSFFSICVTSNIYVLSGNVSIMGKVYFPRLIIPISNVVTNAVNAIGQMVLFVIIYVIYMVRGGIAIRPNIWMLCIPFWFLQMAFLGMGVGLLVSALTVRYRDLSLIANYGISLLMYATPVIYPLSNIGGTARILIMCNPISPVVEGLRYALFGKGVINAGFLGVSLVCTIVIAIMGILVFNKVEKTFIDAI